jgi:hypothetical protein
VNLPDGWRAALNLWCAPAAAFKDSCFRLVETVPTHSLGELSLTLRQADNEAISWFTDLLDAVRTTDLTKP